MKKIVSIDMISHRDPGEFYEHLKRIIGYLQNSDEEVEVQYSNSPDGLYLALILGRKETI